jgi:hypothetical protein
MTAAFGRHVCEALGFDSGRVKSINIGIETDGTVVTVIEQFVSVEEAGRIVEIMKQYDLVPKNEIEYVTSMQDETTRAQRTGEST